MLDILENPHLFNLIRQLIAGEQVETKRFVRDNIYKYKCQRVVDICCGTGDFANCADGLKYLGIDISNNYIEYAKHKYSKDKNKRFIIKDLIKNPLKLETKYDAALLISTLHHFSDQELDIIFKLLQRNIKGVIIIADLDANPDGLLRKIMVKLDRGKFVRSNSEKLSLLKKYFRVLKTQSIKSRLAIQFGVICQN